MNLTFPGRIPADDLVGRLLGPDTLGGYVQVTAVELAIDPLDASARRTTRATVRPVPAAELTHMTRDQFGQWWLPLPAR